MSFWANVLWANVLWANVVWANLVSPIQTHGQHDLSLFGKFCVEASRTRFVVTSMTRMMSSLDPVYVLIAKNPSLRRHLAICASFTSRISSFSEAYPEGGKYDNATAAREVRCTGQICIKSDRLPVADHQFGAANCTSKMLKRFLLLMIVATAMVSATPPLTTDVCTFSKDVGRCRGRKIMFRYNQDEGRCELFLYGGCGGNANRFTSLLECHERCGHLMDENVKSPHIKGDHCLKGPLVENSTRACMGAFPRFTFDKDTLNCQRYLYGGCLGTENLFTSPEECASSCIHGDILRPTSTQRVRYQVNSATTR
jgi:hypothetical protein